jgi:putative spermidine/putrescine transport system substrate-binding protein
MFKKNLVLSMLVVVVLLAAACAPAATPAPAQPAATQVPAQPAATEAPAQPAAQGTSMDELVKAAQAEGMLTVIALPHDWCNYGEVIDAFSKKYGIKVNELNPDGSSADELEAIKANKDNKGPQAPDVVDVGLAFGPQMVAEGLVQPYKVSTWDTIPNEMKDKDGNWWGDFFGVMAFEVNKDLITNVPQDFADLLKPEFKGQIALSGDPRSSAQAQNAIIAAALANGGSLDNVEPGLQYFKKLNDAGNFVPVAGKQMTVAKGETPVLFRWDFNALADKAILAGNPNVEVVIPKSTSLAGLYVQAISKYAPHPNAAKLWEEFLYSDEGQLLWLKGYCHPARYADLNKRGVIPAELAAQLPPAEYYEKAVFPGIEQLNKAKEFIANNWSTIVGADVK